MLKKLDVLDVPIEVVDFIVAFGPLFNHILTDFQRKQDAQTKMAPKIDERSKAWNLAPESDQHAEKMEESLHREDKVVANLDVKILNWKKKIEALYKKVQEVEGEKKTLRRVNQQQLDKETQIGIQHLETITTLDAELEGFKSIISQDDRRLATTKLQYERLKNSLSF